MDESRGMYIMKQKILLLIRWKKACSLQYVALHVYVCKESLFKSLISSRGLS